MPIICEGKITAGQKFMINEHLKKYKDKYEVYKLIMNYHYGSTSEYERTREKTQIGKMLKNFLKKEAEIMEILKAENKIKLK